MLSALFNNGGRINASTGLNETHGYIENPDNKNWQDRCELYTEAVAKNKPNPALQCPKARQILTPMEYATDPDYGLSDNIGNCDFNLPGLPRLTNVKSTAILFGPCNLGGAAGWSNGGVNTGYGCSYDPQWGMWIWGSGRFSFSKGHSGGSGANFFFLDGSVRTWLLNDYKNESAALGNKGFWYPGVYIWGLRHAL